MNLKEMFLDIDRTELAKELYADVKYLGLDKLDDIVFYVDNHVEIHIVKDGEKNTVYISHAGESMITELTSKLSAPRLTGIYYDIMVLTVLARWAYDVHRIKTMVKSETPFVKGVKSVKDSYLESYFSLLISALIAYGADWRTDSGITYATLSKHMLSD